MSVGVGVGLIFLMREGLSLETLRRMPDEESGSQSSRSSGPQRRVNALACPASLKGVLSAREAAAALAEGLAAAVELPVADGGDGTLDVLAPALVGEWREAEVSDPLGRPVVARWLLHDGSARSSNRRRRSGWPGRRDERDPMRASSRGLGELLAEVQDADPAEIVVFLGGTATVDGGAGLMEVLGGFRVPVRAACDVRSPLVDAAGTSLLSATPEQAAELERRLLERRSLEPFRDLPGAGAAAGSARRWRPRRRARGGCPSRSRPDRLPGPTDGADLVVTGEGTSGPDDVDGKGAWRGRLPFARTKVRCALFGDRVVDPPDGVEIHELSGDPARAREDLVALGRSLA